MGIEYSCLPILNIVAPRHLLVACYLTLHPTLSVHRRSVGPSIRPSVTLYFFLGFCVFWPHCSCPNDGVTSILASAHPHATRVAAYLALFSFQRPSQAPQDPGPAILDGVTLSSDRAWLLLLLLLLAYLIVPIKRSSCWTNPDILDIVLGITQVPFTKTSPSS